MCCFPYLPRFAAKCCILENGVHLLAQDTYVNVHIGNKNTQFAVFCIYPTSKEKGADIHCITAFFMLTTRFTFLMTISPISIERYNQYCWHEETILLSHSTCPFAETYQLPSVCSSDRLQEHIYVFSVRPMPFRNISTGFWPFLADRRLWEHIMFFYICTIEQQK